MNCLKVSDNPGVDAPCGGLGDEPRSGTFRGVEANPGGHRPAGLKEAHPLGTTHKGSESPRGARAKIPQFLQQGHLAGAPQSPSRRSLHRLQAPGIHTPEIERTADFPKDQIGSWRARHGHPEVETAAVGGNVR